ncbi:hypothetical protein PABG_01351 [Paracoccidioides brasiliensis Pb03]|nr:hypothetical protein PABG_01351 [Paracoccidioides brasiliensis Pb03]
MSKPTSLTAPKLLALLLFLPLKHLQIAPTMKTRSSPLQWSNCNSFSWIFFVKPRSSHQSLRSQLEMSNQRNARDKGGNEVKARASKLEYKEVHEVWDKDNSKYKIVESVGEDKVLDDLDQMTNETTTFVNIKSEVLLEVLREIVRDVRAISLCARINLRLSATSCTISFLTSRRKERTTETRVRSMWICSSGISRKPMPPQTQSLLPLLKRGEITYDLLWTIFKPGIFVYSTCPGTGKPRCVIFDAGEEKMKMNRIKYFSLDCRYLDFDGEVFGEAGTQLEVVRFHGPRPIHDLEAFPLDHHPSKSDAMRSLIDCGRNFCDLKGQHIRHCRGRAFVQVRGEIVQISIDSRIMVDPAFFRQMNPNYTRPRINQRRYCFSENMWMEFAVADLDQAQWSSATFENLRIPSLVPSIPFDDFVTGKGRGLNWPPRSRKDLHRRGNGGSTCNDPFIEHVAAGELIHDKCLEEHVSNIFKIASHFNSILLIDEDDVFLHGRSIGGVHDHSVTVFLRKLEYYEGILCLTTNRVDEFDDAILSRIHYKLEVRGSDPRIPATDLGEFPFKGGHT